MPAGDGAPLEEPAPQPVPKAETVLATEGNQQGEPAVTPLASLEAQNLEAAVTNTVQ